MKFTLPISASLLKHAAKELGRLLLLALPGIAIQVITDNPELAAGWGATILLVLKSLDRGVHEDRETKSDGILPF